MDPALVQTVACQVWRILVFPLLGLLQLEVDWGPEQFHLQEQISHLSFFFDTLNHYQLWMFFSPMVNSTHIC